MSETGAPVWRRREVASDASSGGNDVWFTLMPMPAMACSALHQNAGHLFAREHDVVGPAQIAHHPGGARDGVRGSETERQREERARASSTMEQ